MSVISMFLYTKAIFTNTYDLYCFYSGISDKAYDNPSSSETRVILSFSFSPFDSVHEDCTK